MAPKTTRRPAAGRQRACDLGALGGTRTPNLLIRSSMCGHPDRFRSVRDLGLVPVRCSWPSGIPEGRSPRWLPAWLPVAEDLAHRFACCGPSAFQAGHIPCWHGSSESYALSPVAAACRWLLVLLSPLLSAAIRLAGGLTRITNAGGAFDIPIAAKARRDMVCCSVRCRQARHRFLRAVSYAEAVARGRPLRLA